MRLFVLFLVFAAACRTAAAAETAACPAPAEKLRELTDARLDELCFQPAKAATPVRNPGARMAAVRRCRANLEQARESANVLYATAARQAGFHPDIRGALDQKSAPDKAAEVLLDAHTFTNISMSAIYRSRLKVRVAAGQTKSELESLRREDAQLTASRAEIVAAEKAARAQGNPAADKLRDEGIPAFERDFEAVAISQRTVADSAKCLDAVQPELDSAFEDWAKVKKDLLAQTFPSLVTGDRYPDPALQGRAAFLAERLQSDQQQVYDNLTDPEKRSTAYRLAEACQENNCSAWASVASTVGWVARTPVISYVAKAVAGSAAFERANGQGLGLWQSLRETGNAVSPFYIAFLDTEIRAIEKGQVRPFQP